MKVFNLLLLAFMVSGAATAAKHTRPPPQPVCSAFGWCKVGTLSGVTSSYTPVVQLGGSQIRVYANTANGVDGSLYLRVGSWSSVGGPSLVLDVTVPRDSFIRTSGIARGASGRYYAVLYTGDGYPTQGGYSPSWATSEDGYAWTWNGPIDIFGRNQSSAANLIVDEARVDDYRFMFWMDLAGVGIVLVHSADGVTWASDRVPMWPIAGEYPQFLAGVKDQYGYHLIGANAYPATALRHVFSCDGLTNWRMLETSAAILGGSVKGTNLAYDAPNNLIHALTIGVHYQIPVRDWGC